MAAELYVPHLGQTVEEVTVVQWLVPDGAEVSQGQPVLEVETDKAIFPLEANATGSIHFGPYKVGQVVPVLTVVATIGKPDEAFVAAGSLASPPAAADAALNEASAVVELASPVLPPAVPGMQKLFASPRARKLAERENVDLQQITPTGYAGVRVAERDVLAFLGQSRKITPVAQRMAAESGVDVRSIAGTGPGGRIRKDDVARALPPQSLGSADHPEVVERIPLRGVRSIIAERMAASVHTSARVTLMMEADATAFVDARTRLKQ